MRNRGGVGVGLLWAAIAILVFFGLLGVACGACFHNDDNDHSLGRVRLVDYRGDRGDCNREGNCNDQRRCHGARGDCRGSFSPGPFDRSPVDVHDNCVSLDCSGSGKDKNKDQPAQPAGIACLVPAPWHCDPAPKSLIPPTPGGVRDFVVHTVQAGLALGQTFATVTIQFVSDLLVGIA